MPGSVIDPRCAIGSSSFNGTRCIRPIAVQSLRRREAMALAGVYCRTCVLIANPQDRRDAHGHEVRKLGPVIAASSGFRPRRITNQGREDVKLEVGENTSQATD